MLGRVPGGPHAVELRWCVTCYSFCLPFGFAAAPKVHELIEQDLGQHRLSTEQRSSPRTTSSSGERPQPSLSAIYLDFYLLT